MPMKANVISLHIPVPAANVRTVPYGGGGGGGGGWGGSGNDTSIVVDSHPHACL